MKKAANDNSKDCHHNKFFPHGKVCSCFISPRWDSLSQIIVVASSLILGVHYFTKGWLSVRVQLSEWKNKPNSFSSLIFVRPLNCLFWREFYQINVILKVVITSAGVRVVVSGTRCSSVKGVKNAVHGSPYNYYC